MAKSKTEKKSEHCRIYLKTILRIIMMPDTFLTSVDAPASLSSRHATVFRPFNVSDVVIFARTTVTK